MGSWGKFDGKRIDDWHRSSGHLSRKSSEFHEMSGDSDYAQNHIMNYLNLFDTVDLVRLPHVISEEGVLFILRNAHQTFVRIKARREIGGAEVLFAARVQLLLSSFDCLQNGLFYQMEKSERMMFPRIAFVGLVIALLLGAPEEKIRRQMQHVRDLFQNEGDFLAFAEEMSKLPREITQSSNMARDYFALLIDSFDDCE